MKEKRKGFTLIDLLAVIVLLAIIALIAIPIVLNLIKSAKKGAFARSAEGVVKSAKTYYLESLVNMEPSQDVIFTCDNSKGLSGDKDLGVSGSMPTPTRDGYNFLGWYTSETDGDKIESTTNVTITQNQTLYAHWEKLGPTVITNDLPEGEKTIFYLDPKRM